MYLGDARAGRVTIALGPRPDGAKQEERALSEHAGGAATTPAAAPHPASSRRRFQDSGDGPIRGWRELA